MVFSVFLSSIFAYNYFTFNMDAIAGGRLGLCFQLVHVRGSAWSRPKHPEMLKHEIFSRAFT